MWVIRAPYTVPQPHLLQAAKRPARTVSGMLPSVSACAEGAAGRSPLPKRMRKLIPYGSRFIGVAQNFRARTGRHIRERAPRMLLLYCYASYAVAANSPSSAAHCATSPSSAMLSARHLPQRSVSAASSRRPRRREQRSTVDFIMKRRWGALLPRAHPFTPTRSLGDGIGNSGVRTCV